MNIQHNQHFDHDDCPCRGPYQITGISMHDDHGIVFADCESDAVDAAQERDEGAYHAFAVMPRKA